MHTISITARHLAVAGFLALVAQIAPASAGTLAEGLDAYRNNRVAEAERILAEVAADPAASPAERAGALRELGRIDSLIRGETDAIAAAMAQTPNGDEACATAAVALRVYRTAGQPAAPFGYAERASAACAPAQADTLRVERARNFIAAAAADPRARAAHLAAAETQLAAVSAVARGAPDVAGARFALAMARHDADAALSAWRDYYWLTDTDAPQALSAYAGRMHALFSAAFARRPANADTLALIELLNRAGFVDEARQYAADANIARRALNNPMWIRANAFFAYDSAVAAAMLRANREMAGGGDASWLADEIVAIKARLVEAAGLSGDPDAVLAETYGVYGVGIGSTGGYPSLHSGHLVQRERLAVSQYGRSGEVEFIVIDHMMANGYESWLWDGWAQAGGWSSDGALIVQVRSAYTGGPIHALRIVRPGPDRDRFLANIERAAADERAALTGDGVATLRATSDRLGLQANEQILARVGNDDDAFIAELWRAGNQSSIESHEGRHALDNAYEPGFTADQLEFRAKLSEITFADYPRIGLASIASQPINETPHGIGNRIVLEGYRDWMRAHASEIPGFDRAQPALMQLPLLSDEQIVAVARSMDPWAR